MKLVLAIALLIAVLALPSAAGAGGSDNKVLCITYDSDGNARFKLRTEPRNCSFLHRHSEPIGANLVDMARVDWKSWGSRKAKGEGQFLVNMTGPVPGRVVLSKPVDSCVGNKTVFSKGDLHLPPGQRPHEHGARHLRVVAPAASRQRSRSASRSSIRRIFPVRVFGSSSTNSILRG